MSNQNPSKASLKVAEKIVKYAYGENVFTVAPPLARQHQEHISKLIEGVYKPLVEAAKKIDDGIEKLPSDELECEIYNELKLLREALAKLQ